MPTLAEFLTKGPAAFVEEKARERAMLLAEMQAAASQPTPKAGDVDGMHLLGLDPQEFGPVQKLDMSYALQDAGIDEKALAAARLAQSRAQTFDEAAARLRAGENSASVFGLANLANDKELVPVGMSGGVAFSRYDASKPVLAEAPSESALATKRAAEAGAAELRLQALGDVLDTPGLNPALKADVANNRAISKPQRVKVRRQDGTEVYMDARPNLSGGWDYSPSASGGQPLRVPAGSSSETSLQRDTRFISQTLGITPEEAIQIKLRSTEKSDGALWAELVLRSRSADKYADDTEIQKKADGLWRMVRPGKEPPVSAATAPVTAPAPATSTDPKADAKKRAAAEGYSNLGKWVDGKGWQVFDKSGKLLGYYY